MADEKRRIIYELLVEAKGAGNAEKQVSSIGTAFNMLKKVAAPVLGSLAAGLTIKGLLEARDEVVKFNQALSTLGVTGKDAAAGLQAVQNIAVVTGQSFEGVTSAYQEAVDLQQTLGRSTAMAGETAEAFIRIAAAEGKTAGDAARQIETLGFALESGVLPAKQFVGLLKESNTFQRAAQEALGKTTAELVAMAQAGQIAEPELTAIVLKMEEIGKSTDAATTVDSFTTSIGNLYRAFKQGIAQGATGTDTKLIDPDEITTSQKLAENAAAAGAEIGGLGVIAKNAGDQMFNALRLGFNVLSGGIDDMKTARSVMQGFTQDANEMADAWERVKEANAVGMFDNEKYSDEAKAARKAERERLNNYAKWLAEEKEMWRINAEGRKEREEKYAAEKAKRDEARQREQEKRERDAAKAAEDRQQEIWRLRDINAARAEKSLDKFAQDTQDEFAKWAENDLQKSLEVLANETIPNMSDSVINEFERIEDVGYVLEDAFTGIFSGATTSAREFFASVVQGIGQIFAQMAAKQAASQLLDWIDLGLGALGIGKGKASPSNASGMPANSLSGWWSAKGNAFDRGHVMPFAAGGVVSGPTVFPMANGGVGVMGEAGPEAVMPLKRTASGKLGVASAMPNITLVNQTGVTATARVEKSNERLTLILEAAQMGANLAESRINRSMRNGYGSTAQSMQRTYGLKRRV